MDEPYNEAFLPDLNVIEDWWQMNKWGQDKAKQNFLTILLLNCFITTYSLFLWSAYMTISPCISMHLNASITLKSKIPSCLSFSLLLLIFVIQSSPIWCFPDGMRILFSQFLMDVIAGSWSLTHLQYSRLKKLVLHYEYSFCTRQIVLMWLCSLYLSNTKYSFMFWSSSVHLIYPLFLWHYLFIPCTFFFIIASCAKRWPEWKIHCPWCILSYFNKKLQVVMGLQTTKFLLLRLSEFCPIL